MRGGVLRFVIFLSILLSLGCPKRVAKREVPPLMEREEEGVVVPPERERVKPPLELKRINFELDRSDLGPEAMEILKENARVLKAYPEVRVLIEGHCCELGTAEYNLALGQRRASSAYHYLVKLGIEPGRLSTISYGEERPLDLYNLPINRRCEFTIKR